MHFYRIILIRFLQVPTYRSLFKYEKCNHVQTVFFFKEFEVV